MQLVLIQQHVKGRLQDFILFNVGALKTQGWRLKTEARTEFERVVVLM